MAGALKALDNIDEFRSDLVAVQVALLELDAALYLVSGDDGYLVGPRLRPDRDAIAKQMAKSVEWRPMGRIHPV